VPFTYQPTVHIRKMDWVEFRATLSQRIDANKQQRLERHQLREKQYQERKEKSLDRLCEKHGEAVELDLADVGNYDLLHAGVRPMARMYCTPYDSWGRYDREPTRPPCEVIQRVAEKSGFNTRYWTWKDPNRERSDEEAVDIWV